MTAAMLSAAAGSLPAASSASASSRRAFIGWRRRPPLAARPVGPGKRHGLSSVANATAFRHRSSRSWRGSSRAQRPIAQGVGHAGT